MIVEMFSQGWLLAICIALAVVVCFFYLLSMRSRSVVRVKGLRRKPSLLNEPEKDLFIRLCDALEHEFFVFPKVGVFEVVERSTRLSEKKYLKLISQFEAERFDFVVCRKFDLSIAAVIKFQSPNTKRTASKKQPVDWLGDLCKKSNLSLFFLDSSQDYRGADIRRLITGTSQRVKKESATKEEKLNNWSGDDLTRQSMMTEYVAENTCPKCHSNLVTKMAMKGEHLGERFLMCRKYPYCEYKVLLEDLDVAGINSVGDELPKNLAKVAAPKIAQERLRKTTPKKSKAGYKDW